MSCKLHLVEKFLTNCIRQDALNFVQIKIVFEEYQLGSHLFISFLILHLHLNNFRIWARHSVFFFIWLFLLSSLAHGT